MNNDYTANTGKVSVARQCAENQKTHTDLDFDVFCFSVSKDISLYVSEPGISVYIY